MKKKLLYSVCSLVMACALASCDYLDIVPDGTPTEKDAFANQGTTEGYLYSCYGFIPNNGNTQSAIDFLSGDEVVTAFESDPFAAFSQGTYTAISPHMSYWDELMGGMRYCYTLINNVDGVPGMSKKMASDYKAQAKFLVGYFYYLLIQSYGPVIIVKDVEDVNVPIDKFKARAPMSECVDFAANMLDEAAKDLPPTRDGDEYGLATSVAAKTLKAKLLVMAASPLFNGYAPHKNIKNADGAFLFEQKFDQSKWDRAYEACQEAVRMAEKSGFALYKAVPGTNVNAPEPADMTQRSLRFAIIDKGNLSETIWGNTKGQSNNDIQAKSAPYAQGDKGRFALNAIAPTLAMMERFYTDKGLPLDEDPSFPSRNDWWKVVDAPAGCEYAEGKVPAFVCRRDPRMYAWTTFENGYYEIAGDKPEGSNYDKKYRRGKAEGKIVMKMMIGEPSGRGANLNTLRNNNYSPSGFLNKRLVDPLKPASSPKINYIHPYLTMADLYLLAAEAAVEVNKLGEAKTYLDKIRYRAGLPSVDTAWAHAAHPDKANGKEGMREIVRQERLIEMYMLNQNFWDLRRWLMAERCMDKAPDGVNILADNIDAWWKPTQVQVSRAFTAPTNYLMPIPQEEIKKNPKIVQNPGY